MKCLEDGCEYTFYETKDGMAQWTIHRILMHPKSQEEKNKEHFNSTELGKKIASIEEKI